MSVCLQIFAQCVLFSSIFFGRLRRIHLWVRTGSSLAPSAAWSQCVGAQLPYVGGGDI